MNCPACGKMTRLIATSREDVACCEMELTEVVTEGGRVFKGYMRHRCDDGRERDGRDDGGR